MKFYNKISIKKCLIIVGHILSFLFSWNILNGISLGLVKFSIPFPEILFNDFVIIGSTFLLPIISILLFIFDTHLINRLLSFLYFVIWAFGIYNLLFCNC